MDKNKDYYNSYKKYKKYKKKYLHLKGGGTCKGTGCRRNESRECFDGGVCSPYDNWCEVGWTISADPEDRQWEPGKSPWCKYPKKRGYSPYN